MSNIKLGNGTYDIDELVAEIETNDMDKRTLSITAIAALDEVHRLNEENAKLKKEVETLKKTQAGDPVLDAALSGKVRVVDIKTPLIDEEEPEDWVI